MRLVTWL